MKNIMKVALLSLLCAGAVSCNLEKYPSNAVPESEGFLTFQDASEFRNGFYNYSRSCFSSYTVLPINLQGEGMNPTKDFGNQYGFQYAWTFADNDVEVTTLWTNCYLTIFQLNYFLEKSAELLKKIESMPDFDAESQEVKDLNLYIAEARFFRAMINRQLAIFYCKDYDPATADKDLGIIISDKVDITARLRRSSLAKTYEWINEDLEYAKGVIYEYYGENATGNEFFIGPYTVKSLQAKVLMDMHQYIEAAALCEEIVNKYPLITTQNAFSEMWKNDEGTEIVFQFYASSTEGRTQYGEIFLHDPNNNGVQINPLYIPSQWMIDQYDKLDYRSNVYFTKKNMRIGSQPYNLFAFTKYPGNPDYNTNPAVNEFMHNVRPYRSADFQLMAAECYAMANDLGQANAALEKLITSRMNKAVNPEDDYKYVEASSLEEMMNFIKQERLKELLMEGNRIADLKRWGDPMSRIAHDPQDSEVVSNFAIYLNIPADDYRFVWPIPQSEKDQNHSISDQLNWSVK